ncbi:MAG: CsgG/HfaB family protein [Candidatus Nitrospinota bacterium M3_3B_026]
MKKILSFAGLLALASILTAVPAEAAKPILAVDEFKNDTRAHWWKGGTGRDLAGMLTNELAAGGKLKMVERKKLESVLKEQDLGASGRIRKDTAAQIGKLTGAQYLVMGTVTAFEEDTSKVGGGLSFKGFSLGGKKKKAYLAVDLRVVNTTTGDISFTRTVEASSSGGGLSLGVFRGGFGGTLGGEEKTPVGKAIRACVIEISEYLECMMVKKDSCMQEYEAKEERRRERTKGAIELE